jgi:hypothetical protein
VDTSIKGNKGDICNLLTIELKMGSGLGGALVQSCDNKLI